MRFTFIKHNTRTKKHVNCFLQDGASEGMLVFADLYCNKTLPTAMKWTLRKRVCVLSYPNWHNNDTTTPTGG